MSCHFTDRHFPAGSLLPGSLLLFLLVCALIMASPAPSVAADDTAANPTADANALPDFISLWDFNDPAATEAKFREILPAAEASGDAGYLAELLTQIARTYSLRDNFAEAHATLDRVEGMLTADNAQDMEKARMRYLLERGRSFNSAGEPDKAQPLFLQAWELGQATTYDGLTIDAAHMLGIVTQGQESLDWNLKALALAEITPDPKAAQWQGALYNNIGWTYMDMREYETALELFQRGVDFREEMQHGETSRMIAHWTVARALRALGRNDEALAKLQYISVNFPGYVEDGFWYEEMGENLLAEAQMQAARENFSLALALLEEHEAWLLDEEPQRMARLRDLAEGADLQLLEIGAAVPDFSLPNQFGEQLSLSQFAGEHPAVLIFYKKDKTGG